MKRSFVAGVALTSVLAGHAMAADMPIKSPIKSPMDRPDAFSWTGFYIGGHVGYGWGNKKWSEFDPNGIDRNHTNSFGVSGVVAGAQVGYDHQIGAWVFGVEGQWSWSDINGDRRDLPPETLLCTAQFACNTHVKWIATATARLGYAFGPALLYAKGGGAWVREDHRFIEVATGADFASAHETRSGWTVGGGLEYRLDHNWSTKIEYNYIDFGDRRLFFANLGRESIGIDQQIHLVKVGVNYRFGGPAAAKF
jgi:outer membrane immunogenic protein